MLILNNDYHVFPIFRQISIRLKHLKENIMTYHPNILLSTAWIVESSVICHVLFVKENTILYIMYIVYPMHPSVL